MEQFFCSFITFFTLFKLFTEKRIAMKVFLSSCIFKIEEVLHNLFWKAFHFNLGRGC